MNLVRTPRLIFALGVVQAVLYCTLLPLWEGIDEPFHYGYVQCLARTWRLPVLEKTTLSEEVERSLPLAPSSHVVAAQIPGLTTFEQYFALPEPERASRRAKLRQLPPSLADRHGSGDNYQAQQPPLAYAMLAPLELAQRNAPLLQRVWTIRLACALASLAMILFAIYELGSRMGLGADWADCAAFCLVCTQNWWCAVAHVANDWLSLPLLALLALAFERFWETPGKGPAVLMGTVLGAGLLAKSYFLLVAPVALGAAAWRSRKRAALAAAVSLLLAGWWYWRNLELYGDLTGLQRAVRGVSIEQVLLTAQSIDWLWALTGMARGALWSGNSSFTTFSASTLNTVLCLLAAGCALWIQNAWRSGTRPAGWILAIGAAAFAVAPVYAMLQVGTLYRRVSPAANSWHAAGLLPAAFLICFAGLEGSGRLGRWIARALTGVIFYVSVATYWAKLLPIYSGHGGTARLALLVEIYAQRSNELAQRLGEAAIGSGPAVLALAAAESIIAGLGFTRVFRALGETERNPQIGRNISI